MKTNSTIKPLSKRIAIGTLAILVGLMLPACVVAARPYHRPALVVGTPVVYDVLPVGYVGAYYRYGGRYYCGGRYETGRFLWHGRYYGNRYFHNGHYFYGGVHFAGRI